MNIPDNEINSILYNFPKFELSYEIITHKKVYDADVVVAVPEGKKYFAWFTSYKEQNVCFILEINEHKRIINVKISQTSFNDKLAFGTVLYGTMFKYNTNDCFCIEDIVHYKGQHYLYKPFLEKLNTLKNILSNDISQTALTTKYIIFGLPAMSNDFNALLRDIDFLPYKITQIKFRYFHSQKILERET